MRCPEPVHDAVCEILRWGTLRARAAGWSGNAAGSAIESDHIHNLPDLLRDYSIGKLDAYLNGDRQAFLTQVGADAVREFQAAWDLLERLSSCLVQSADAR